MGDASCLLRGFPGQALRGQLVRSVRVVPGSSVEILGRINDT